MQLNQPTPQRPPDNHVHRPAPIATDITRSSRSLAIALVVSAFFLLGAIAVAIWIFVSGSGFATPTVTSPPPNDTRNVKNVILIPPALPANYVKNDQSTNNVALAHYYDDGANCGFTVGVTAVPDSKTAQEAAVELMANAATAGVTTTNITQGQPQPIKDADNATITYEFAALEQQQSVNVQGVAFTKQQQQVLFKQFGARVAVIAYTCKSDTWAERQPELATLTALFTAKTER